jgi:chromosome segregation ATPase
MNNESRKEKPMIALFFLLFPVEAAAAEGGGNLSLWFILILLLVVAALVAVLLIRDKALRDKAVAVLGKIKKMFTRMRLKHKIKAGQRATEEAFRKLGQEAWKAGHKPETAAEILRELGTLDATIKAKATETEKAEAEEARIKQGQAQFLEGQKAKIAAQEEAARPHREETARQKAKLRDIEGRLAEAEKSARAADAERLRAENDLAAIQNDPAVPADQKAVRLTDTRMKIAVQIQQKAAAEAQLGPLGEQRASMNATIAHVQSILDGYDKVLADLANEQKEKTRAADAAAAELTKKKSGLRAEIEETEKKRHPHWTALGRDLSARRIDDPALTPFYAEIDRLERNLQDLENRLRALKA